jgi:hypothetical protein
MYSLYSNVDRKYIEGEFNLTKIRKGYYLSQDYIFGPAHQVCLGRAVIVSSEKLMKQHRNFTTRLQKLRITHLQNLFNLCLQQQ